jgi:hypothetical protein
MKLARRPLQCLLALTIAASGLGPAMAQPTDAPPASPGDLAIAKGEQAMAAFDRQEWEQALAAFREADKLYHSPVFTLYEARSLKALARMTEAAALLDAARNEQLPAGAPASWYEAKNEAASELLTLRSELPRVVIRVRNARAAKATLDDKPVALGVPIEADPGEHRVAAMDGARTLTKNVTLRVGAETSAELDFGRSPELPPRNDGWLISGTTLTSVGGAGLIAGAIFGGLALDRTAEADAALPQSCTTEKRCPTRDQTAIEQSYQGAYDFANASDGLFVAGGVLAVAGIVILIVDSTSKGAPSPVSAHASGLRLHF